MKASEQAKELGTTVKSMAEKWQCSIQALLKLHKERPHKFKIIALGTKAVEVIEVETITNENL